MPIEHRKCPLGVQAHLSGKIKVGVIGEVDGSGFIRLGLIFNSQCVCLKKQNKKNINIYT